MFFEGNYLFMSLFFLERQLYENNELFNVLNLWNINENHKGQPKRPLINKKNND